MRELLLMALLVALTACNAAHASPRQIVFLPGKGSHGYGSHAFVAGSRLLADLLNQTGLDLHAVVHEGGWPRDPSVLKDAAAVVIFCDANNVIGNRYAEADALAAKGVGFAFLHYALDVGNKERGAYLLRWIGGYYEQHWSVNPSWAAEFKMLPDHPVARGVRPFKIMDEWYYHMRFVEGMAGVTPLLTAVPPDKTRERPDGPHSNNPTVRSRRGAPEHVAWAFDRPGGGRGFGFTGGHSHWNWGHDDFRKLVLNAIVWLAGLDVPNGGISSPAPSADALMANQEAERPKDLSPEKITGILNGIRGGK